MHEKPEWMKRLDEEYQSLCDKITRLRTFLNDQSALGKTCLATQIMLKKQLSVMEEYRDILEVRLTLAAWELVLNDSSQRGVSVAS